MSGQRLSAFFALSLFAGTLGACTHFVDVDTHGQVPLFSWRAAAPVTSLTVLADEDCPQLGGKTAEDRIWWQISGDIKPPVTYGILPRGAAELARARPLAEGCGPWTVILSDPSMQGVRDTFRF